MCGGEYGRFSFAAAVSTTDYVAQTAILDFKPCDSVKCIDVATKDDCVVEELESIEIFLTTPSYVDERIKLFSGHGQIFINDNDSMTESGPLLNVTFLFPYRDCGCSAE